VLRASAKGEARELRRHQWGDAVVTKKRVGATQGLKKERGVWVIRAGGNVSVSDVNRIIRQIREERYALSIGREPIKRCKET
jgi:hypothetical protein